MNGSLYYQCSAMRVHSTYTFITCALIVIGLGGCSTTPKLAAGFTAIPDGTYVLDPHTTWNVGWSIEVRGKAFSYYEWSDAGKETSVNGTIRAEDDHFVFEREGKPFQRWYVARLRGLPVLWSSKGYVRWRKSHKVDDSDVLYRREDLKS
jgi:hypothetical protein